MKDTIHERIIEKLEFIKTKNFCIIKQINVKRMEDNSQPGKTFAKELSNKELLSKVYKELLKLNYEKI